MATVLVQSGTLKRGDVVLAGSVLRSRSRHAGRKRQNQPAGPSIPVEIKASPDVPGAGDEFMVLATNVVPVKSPPSKASS